MGFIFYWRCVMPRISDPKVRTVDAENSVIIEAAQSESSAIDVRGTSVFGFYVPDSWTDCNVSFHAAFSSNVDATFFDVHSEGAPYSVATTGLTFVAIPPYILATCRQIKLFCDTPQAAERVVYLALGPLFS
jgi:hypothetical protein